ncbi:MAG: hypothetical protein ACXWTT_00950 [Methylobacter sp.]
MSDSDLIKFKASFEINKQGCWIWTGKCHELGAGRFYYKNEFSGKKVQELAARVSFRLCNQVVLPKNARIIHTCGGGVKCVNPEHLGLRGNGIPGKYDKPGDNYPMGKLTEGQVLEIRDQHSNHKAKQSVLALKYDVSTACIYNIIHRKSWKHL